MAFFGGASVDLASPSAIGSTTPNTGAFTTLSFAPANNTTGFSNTSNSLTGSNAQSLINLAQTWNTTGTPTAINLNITNTASNSSSKFIDFQIGGISQCFVGYNGANPVFNIKSTTSTVYSIAGNGASLLFYYGASISNSIVFTFGVPGIVMPSTGSYGFGASTDVSSGAGDLYLVRDAANILAQRRTTNAQTFRLYNTFTSATNFERVNFRWASNEFILDAEKGSVGGTLRGVKIGSATTSLLGFYGVTPVDQPDTVTDPTGGGTQDAEARTAINAIIDRMQELGLIA